MSEEYVERISISKSSDGHWLMSIVRQGGYDKTYNLPEDDVRFLFNRIGRELQ